jgi:hypothetical protein
MAYPQLGTKIDLLHKKYGVDPAAIAQRIKKDKATAWRWLFQRPDRLSSDKQQLLVKAICETLNNPQISESIFWSNNIRIFCQSAGLSKLEAAIYSGFSLPVPEIILDSLFDLTADVLKYVGNYILFRHDKESNRGEDRYIQTCVKISRSKPDLLMYEDFAIGNANRVSYEGNIYLVGTILNIVGQSKMRGRGARPELWWCGLKVGITDDNDQARVLYGYVSDLTSEGGLYTDRLALLRVSEEKWLEIRNKNEFRISASEVRALIGERFMDYLDKWRDVPIDEPF